VESPDIYHDSHRKGLAEVGALIRAYGKLVFHIIYGLTGGREESLDLTQERQPAGFGAVAAGTSSRPALRYLVSWRTASKQRFYPSCNDPLLLEQHFPYRPQHQSRSMRESNPLHALHAHFLRDFWSDTVVTQPGNHQDEVWLFSASSKHGYRFISESQFTLEA
jgi:hypothetical protein